MRIEMPGAHGRGESLPSEVVRAGEGADEQDPRVRARLGPLRNRRMRNAAVKGWMRMNHCLIGIAFSMTLSVVACSSDETAPSPAPAATGHASPYPACNAIIQACHPLDVGEGPIHDCHDLG